MGSERLVAGVFAGVGALVLLYKGESATAVAILIQGLLRLDSFVCLIRPGILLP